MIRNFIDVYAHLDWYGYHSRMLVLPDNFNGFCHLNCEVALISDTFCWYFDKTVTRLLQIVARLIGWIKKFKNAQDAFDKGWFNSMFIHTMIQLIKCLLMSPLIGIVEPSESFDWQMLLVVVVQYASASLLAKLNIAMKLLHDWQCPLMLFFIVKSCLMHSTIISSTGLQNQLQSYTAKPLLDS